jgi:hypothetical protein
MTVVVRRHGFRVALGALTIAICVIGAFLVAILVAPEVERAGYLGPRPTPPPSPVASPSPSPALGFTMRGASIPITADCAACHRTDAGTIGVQPIPAVAHPIEGWGKCTACHTTDGLVRTAPGHSGIHADQCLLCHKVGDLPAPLSRPHRATQNTACLDCHGTAIAPLPADMTHRSQNVCWLCHRLPAVAPPVPAHQTASGETDCVTCHTAAKVGPLPPDHADRTTRQCLLCHEVPLGSTPPT